MNEIDVKNMELIIELRNEFKRRWKEGGDLSANEIWGLSNDTVNRNIEQYKLFEKQKRSSKIKELVDQIFAICNEPDEDGNVGEFNTIVLTAANKYEDCRYASPADEPFDIIDWDHFGHRYNSLYFPINEEIECHPKANDLYIQLKQEIAKLGIPDAKDFWRDSDAVNECWYGCIGIMKDYKIVSFVIRDDNMLSSGHELETPNVAKDYYNHILMEL